MKTKLLVVPIFCAVIFLAAAPTHAASGATPLPKEDAVVLQQALDVVKKVLDELSAKVNANDEMVLGNASDLNGNLSNVATQLIALKTTLLALNSGGQNLSLNYPGSVQAPTQMEQIAPSVAIQPSKQTMSPQKTETVAPGAQLAVASKQVSPWQIVWLALLVVAAVGVIWSFPTKKQAVAKVPQVQMTKHPIIVREESEPTITDLAQVEWE